jgi:glycosyltransferase involved in cell wall biosynthesis
MKVLYLIDSLIGYGAEKSLVEITTRFKHIEPVFVQIYVGDQLKNILEENKISVYSLNLTDKYNFQSAVNAVVQIIEKENPQIIHSTLFRADIIARKIKKKLPHILLVGSLVNNSYSTYRFKEMNFRRRIQHLIVKEWDKRTAKYVDYFISNSEAILETNVEALKLKREKIQIIYRGRDFSLFSGKRVHQVLLPFEKKNSLVFFNVSRLENRKGQKDLIRAFSLFLISNPSAKLLIAGEGPEEESIKDLIDQIGINQSVFLLGYRKDISGLLKVADFFVFPSYFEGLPGALIEAVISRTPTIISDIPENKECLPNDNNLLFEPGNIEEMAKRMVEATQVKNWKERTELAFDFAHERFEINEICKKYEKFYLNIIQKHMNAYN